MIHSSPALLPLLAWARRKISLEELRRISRHSGNVDQSYELTMKNLEFLLEYGLVRIEDNRLAIGELKNFDWLNEGLLHGDAVAWAIADSFHEGEKKFDPDSDLLSAIGLRGESFVLELLHRQVPTKAQSAIKHVSLSNDSAGYDIEAPFNDSGTPCYLEVKTTIRPTGSFRFFLSRNEWKTSTRKQNWFLVLVSLNRQNSELFGHLDSVSLANYMPKERHRDFPWQVTRGSLSRDDVFSGLPVRFPDIYA